VRYHPNQTPREQRVTNTNPTPSPVPPPRSKQHRSRNPAPTSETLHPSPTHSRATPLRPPRCHTAQHASAPHLRPPHPLPPLILERAPHPPRRACQPPSQQGGGEIREQSGESHWEICYEFPRRLGNYQTVFWKLIQGLIDLGGMKG